MKESPDITGMTFGRLTVVERRDVKKRKMWRCVCSCNGINEVVVSYSSLKSGNTQSCGCLKKEIVSSKNKARRKMNRYEFDDECGVGYTENGERFLFDKEDFERIKDFCWRYDSQGYVVTNALVGGKRTSLKLHRYVIGEIDDGMVVDHIVHPKDPRARKEDNRKSNLRVVTRAQNSQNQVPIRSTNTSGHRGVSWNKNGYWRSAISANGVRHMKYFPKDQFEEACEWYGKMAKELYGEYEYCDAEKGE